MLKELSMTNNKSFSLLMFAAVRLMNGFANASASNSSKSVRSDSKSK